MTRMLAATAAWLTGEAEAVAEIETAVEDIVDWLAGVLEVTGEQENRRNNA